jgi:hypothetical protein
MEVVMRMPVLMLLLILVTAAPSAAQSIVIPPQRPIVANLSGPRFGVTTLSDGVVEKLRDRHIEVDPVISQFGWQFEKQFYTKDGGLAMLNEWVFLVGGLDQNIALPSLSWLVGVRTANGSEFGVGPNITPTGISLAIAAGTTMRAGFLNVPVNVAVVPSKSGMRVSFLTGFSLRKP